VNIIVSIKQVPETSNVRMDEKTGTMVREGVESIINPLDLYAIEAAIQLKEQHGGQVTVISMGPRNAEKAVREAMAMGCDAGVLVSDRSFAGSDTHATSYCLSRAIAKLAPFDLILMGVRATDGDTGQVGPGVAAFLGLPLCTYASRILAVGGGKVTVERLVEAGYETLRLPLPCLLTVGKDIGYPRLPTLRGKQRARKAEVRIWGPADLDVDAAMLGLEGSPTRVVKIARPKVTRQGQVVDVGRLGPQEAARELVDFLEEKNLL
jgi:electron transfer flavoprotein beta subunit